jgi:hypothetical protein
MARGMGMRMTSSIMVLRVVRFLGVRRLKLKRKLRRVKMLRKKKEKLVGLRKTKRSPKKNLRVARVRKSARSRKQVRPAMSKRPAMLARATRLSTTNMPATMKRVR